MIGVLCSKLECPTLLFSWFQDTKGHYGRTSKKGLYLLEAAIEKKLRQSPFMENQRLTWSRIYLEGVSMRSRLAVITILVLVCVISSQGSAEEWVAKMFQEQEHDFGSVARGSDTVHRFEIRNIYKQDVYLTNVRSSCGCTTPTIENKVLKTGDTGYVVAKFNTRKKSGMQGATLTVQAAWNDQGRRRVGETQLRVHGNIRGDVVFQPGAVKFDGIDQGTTPEQTVHVTYAGRSTWKIADVRSVSEDFEVELIQRQRYSGRVSYDLKVRMRKTAPAGYFKQQLVLVTNDDRHPRIPLDVEGRVIPEISVAPERLVLGDVQHGEPISKKIIVRGKQPFRIVSIGCDRDCFQFQTEEETKKHHIVQVSFHPKQGVGTIQETIHIKTDLGPSYCAKLTAYATVVSAP